MIKIQCFKKDITVEELNQIELQTMGQDWFGNPIAFKVEYALVKDPSAFFFVAACNKIPTLHPESKAGSFVEGLWNYDVAEIFFGFSNAKYHEFNIDPQATYWSQYFETYRNPASDNLAMQLNVRSYKKNDGWKVALEIPHSLLVEEPQTAHVSFILHTDSEIFISSNSVKEIEPDFHDSRCFTALELV